MCRSLFGRAWRTAHHANTGALQQGEGMKEVEAPEAHVNSLQLPLIEQWQLLLVVAMSSVVSVSFIFTHVVWRPRVLA